MVTAMTTKNSFVEGRLSVRIKEQVGLIEVEQWFTYAEMTHL